MNNDIKEVLRKQKELTTKESRKIYDEISRLKKHNAKIYYEIRQYKKDGNEKSAYYVSKQLKKNEIKDLQNKIKGVVTFKYKNINSGKGFNVSVKQLKRLKNPEKYIKDKYVKTTIKQFNENLKQNTVDSHNRNKFILGLLLKHDPNNKDVLKLKDKIENSSAKSKGLFEGLEGVITNINERTREYPEIIKTSGNTIEITSI